MGCIGVRISLAALFLLFSNAIAQQDNPVKDEVDYKSARNGETGSTTAGVTTEGPGGDVVPSEVEQRELGAEFNNRWRGILKVDS